jgi:hypothetical protein
MFIDSDGYTWIWVWKYLPCDSATMGAREWKRVLVRIPLDH